MATAATQAPTALPTRTRDSFNRQSLGATLNSKIKDARVLMVGAGGIGCELLKNIVLTGFGAVTIVDLDTIDLSNLNRQFLFRHEHIKKSKALVAKEAAHAFNPKVKIEAHHANIKEPHFNVEWYRGFSLVFNALDNLDARRHVNKMCLAANVPLIESGTTGFNGQVQVIKKSVTACYDCTTKETPKSFPVCTIRSTPSQPIHCIVWAKSYLLNEIFGESEDASAFDHSQDADNAKEIAELKKEAEDLRKIRESIGTEEFPKLLFDKVFHRDIARLLSMEDMWESRQPPKPLVYDDLKEKARTVDQSVLRDDQVVWSLEANVAVLDESLDRLSKRFAAMKKEQRPDSPPPTISFDKDDEDTLSFVAAAANIRSHIFGIDAKSEFDIKQMAGNIIPAIATTNAIVAGLCVLEAMKVLKDEYDAAKEVFLTPFAPQRLLAPDRPREPQPNCPVCSTFYLDVYVDFERVTLEHIIEDFVRKQLGYGNKEISVKLDANLLYDPDDTDNLPKKLGELNIKSDSFLTIVDEDDDDIHVDVALIIQQSKEPLGDAPIQSLEPDKAPNIPKKMKKEPTSNGAAQTNGNHLNGSSNDLKRRREDTTEDNLVAKKAKTVAKVDDGDIVVVADGEGADTGPIVLDDD